MCSSDLAGSGVLTACASTPAGDRLCAHATLARADIQLPTLSFSASTLFVKPGRTGNLAMTVTDAPGQSTSLAGKAVLSWSFDPIVQTNATTTVVRNGDTLNVTVRANTQVTTWSGTVNVTATYPDGRSSSTSALLVSNGPWQQLVPSSTTIIGAPTVNAHGSICNVSNCYQAPMSLDDLIEMGGDSSYSLMVIAAIAVTPAAGMLIGCFGNNGRGAIGYEATKQGGMYGTSSTGFAATVAGARSTANQMFGSSHDVNNGHFYLQRTGAALQTASVAVPAAPRVPFSSDMIRIGGSLAASGWASNHTIIGGAAFSRDLTQDEHEEAMAALVPWLADFGVVL